MSVQSFVCTDLGRMAHAEAYQEQLRVHEQVRSGAQPDTLLFVEHDPVLTLGANFHESNLLLSAEEYARRGIAIERTDRGGDVTYHGPDQLVIYPIFDLNRHGRDLHRWLRDLEEAVILALASFGVEGRRFAPHTGVWVEDRKIAAIGIKVKQWVNLHGIALNCCNDLSVFEWFIPCGIEGYGVTSLTECAGRPIELEDAKVAAVRAFGEVF